MTARTNDPDEYERSDDARDPRELVDRRRMMIVAVGAMRIRMIRRARVIPVTVQGWIGRAGMVRRNQRQQGR
jgi:hypothetical protein